MPRLQSEVSSGKKAKRGAAVQATGSEPLKTPKAGGPPESKEAKYPPRPIRARGEGVDTAAWANGRGDNDANRAELKGHNDAGADAARARGNNPVRGPGKTTPATTVDRGMD